MAKKKTATQPATQAPAPQSNQGFGFDLKAALAPIVSATQGGSFVFVPDAVRSQIPVEYVVYNEGMKDANGATACKATDAGIAFMSGGGSTAGQAQTNDAPKPKVQFALVVATPGLLPPAKRGFGQGGAKREETYPFSKMELGQYLIFPKTDTMPDPARSLASTVSSASRRFSRIVEGQTKMRNVKGVSTAFPVREYDRKFEIREVDDIGSLGPQFAAYKGQGGAVVERTK